MNSKERVLCAINNMETDRPCCNFRAESTAVRKILDSTGISDIDALQDELGTDIRHIDAIIPEEIKKEGFTQNFWGERYIYYQTEFGPERENIDGAFAQMNNIEEFMSFDWVKNNDFDYSNIPYLCSRYKNKAIMYGSADVWQRATMMRGLQNFMIDMYENPEMCHFLSKKLTDFYIEDYRRAFTASHNNIDIFLVYSDVGSQRAPMISLGMFETFVLPYIKRIGDAVHSMGAHLFFHTCGMVSPFISLLIEAGVDILDPIQPVAQDMQPEALASKYGGKLCFHGGIDIQRVLAFGKPKEVEAEVNRYVNAFRDRCGYICAPSHFLQRETPVENVLALYKTIRESR